MVKKSILAKVGDKINYKLIRDGYKTDKGNVVVTAEMDTKTTIVADVPSTAYTSNLDYEVDISGENPPIINIKNDITCPDDTVISKGKYLFYDIGQEYAVEDKNKIIEPIKNYTKVGNINVDSNGIVSNFSTSNYIKLNTYLPSTFDIVIKYKHNSVTDSQPGELIANPTTDNSLYIYYNGNPPKFGIGLYVEGVSPSFETNNHVQYETGSWYWIRLIYNGSEEKIYVIKDNNYTIKTLPQLSSWSHEQTKPVSNLWKDMYVTVGANLPYGKYNNGSIDLNNTYIYELGTSYTSYIPGIKDFTLKDNGNELTTKLFDYHYREEIPYKVNLTKIGNISVNSDGTVSNFSTSNYLRMLDKPSSSTTNFEMLFHFKCTSFSNNEILMGDSGNVWNNVLIYVYNNRFQIGNNRYWYTGTHEILLNKEYWGKVIFNNGTLSSYISEDGITYEQDYTGSLSSYVWNNNADIGYSASDNVAFQGTIWLEDCYVQYGNGEKTYFIQKSQSNDKTNLYVNPEKDNALYYEKDELQLNVSKVGSCVIDKNGIASNFGNNSYVTFGKLNASNNPWEMVFKVKYKEHSGFQRFCGSSSDNPKNLLITVSDEDKLSLYISTNGSDWSISGKNSKTTLVNGTTYYIKALFNGTNYILLLSTDGINYNEEINEASTTPMYNGVSTNFQIGCAFSDKSQYNWQGTIDLKESYIQIGTNEKKYFAEKVTKRYNIPSLYSEFIDNITIPAHALYEYVNGEWKLSGDSPIIPDTPTPIDPSTLKFGDRIDDKATVVGEYSSNDGKKYAFAVLDAQYRGTNIKWSTELYGIDTGLPNYSSAPIEQNKESATYNTDYIINNYSDKAIEAFTFCRNVGSILIGEKQLNPQLPNAYELQQIFNKKTELDALDPTAEANSTKKLSNWGFGSQYTGVWSSVEYNSAYSWVLISDGSWSSDYYKDDTVGVVPILEIELS